VLAISGDHFVGASTACKSCRCFTSALAFSATIRCSQPSASNPVSALRRQGLWTGPASLRTGTHILERRMPDSHADEYRTNAEDCLAQARKAYFDPDHAAWLMMAEAWLRLAEDVERSWRNSESQEILN
jgi:hypothetical protein